ncbi:uncharacterized protein L3040_008098 [Drepanopeziza brunnea f. sp. 'multigermtubi']|uniref:Uncharacterized protein n=1 Tax=Marssonina brunnea f. sp. multigermtubi (strain MB_m1) TaxID=1072389 RepID=K1WYQ3_MARBU|nr:uncharacterized protein MBM_04086 [Drepanopeziza brunnea f. sp. 'multigermtubi' MB_m1]EKD17717.1 hypothetical protein MBM_04086 [Drepanopeziza brunnea f. sp. 'multigermtubi' MB_m1]KAJ5035633.1 hypothetical protein L3040_008098 [Drepanopeziza brunnea f. sp. 'multigermtubi']
MPSKMPVPHKSEASHKTHGTGSRKKTSLMNAFRSKGPTDQHGRTNSPIETIRPKGILKNPLPSVAEPNNDHVRRVLTSSSSEAFIAKMKSELYLSQFKRAQEAYLERDLDLCIHHCTEILESSSLHLDTRIETLQLLATITPLSKAHEHLSAALRLLDLAAVRGANGEHLQILLGLRITTLDILARVENEIVMFELGVDDSDSQGRIGSVRFKGAKRMGANVKMIYRPLVSLLARSMPLHKLNGMGGVMAAERNPRLD